MFEIDQLLRKVKRIHFIGIGGSGMCPIVEILHTQGYEITGSDNNETDNLARMRALGIPVTLGQTPENIEGAELIIYTAAILPDNPELLAAQASGIPLFERNDLLGALTRHFSNCIGVSGTHGKTTTCAMLTHLLLSAGLDPSAVIGGKLPLTGTNGRIGKTEHFVCESCEFQDHFLKLSPNIAILLNVDEDHMEYFKTLERLKQSFTQFAGSADKLVIYNGDDANTLDCVRPLLDAGKPAVSYGLGESCDFRAVNLTNEHEYYAFDVVRKGEPLGRVQLGVPGAHNVGNALAVIAAAMASGASFDQCAAGIPEFHGAGRRFETLAQIDGITVADDYAHHPKELEVTLETAMRMGFRKVWAVFQPFTFSRTAMLFDDFVRVLKIPDHCIMTEIMGSREVNTYNIYTSQLAEKIPGSVWFDSFEVVAQYAVDHAQSGDLIITLGCGDIYKAAKIMIKKLQERRNPA
ncbi:MAG: UDP-N-acetylmuramate--L-alanine ligase [Clostridia bacterium]|nr:UDP-N-acetylmuramate--L-alanine ligase [Clostridia bacterium]